MDDAQDLALLCVLRLHRAAPLELLGGREVVVAIDLVDGVGDVRHHEQRRIFGRHRLDALVRQVHRAPALVHDEVQLVLEVPHLLLGRGQLAIGETVELDALHQLLDTGFVQELQQFLVLRHAQLRLIQQDRAIVRGLLVREQRFALRDQVVHDRRLFPNQLHDLAVELGVFLVRLGAHGARNDQRGAGFIDENRVDFVDDRVHVPPLDALLQAEHHVVPQVVEPELVVRPVRDVAQVGGAPLGGRRLRVVDAPDRQAEPGEEMAHPLRVAPRQVVVDRDEMRAPARQRVEIFPWFSTRPPINCTS